MSEIGKAIQRACTILHTINNGRAPIGENSADKSFLDYVCSIFCMAIALCEWPLRYIWKVSKKQSGR